MKKIQQFRYYYSNSTNNYPNNIGSEYYGKLINGNIFSGYGEITHIGIQAWPGTKFSLNDSPFDIEVGETGIYELDLGEYGHIYSIRFDATTLDMYYTRAANRRLLIDIMYEGGN